MYVFSAIHSPQISQLKWGSYWCSLTTTSGGPAPRLRSVTPSVTAAIRTRVNIVTSELINTSNSPCKSESTGHWFILINHFAMLLRGARFYLKTRQCKMPVFH